MEGPVLPDDVVAERSGTGEAVRRPEERVQGRRCGPATRCPPAGSSRARRCRWGKPGSRWPCCRCGRSCCRRCLTLAASCNEMPPPASPVTLFTITLLVMVMRSLIGGAQGDAAAVAGPGQVALDAVVVDRDRSGTRPDGKVAGSRSAGRQTSTPPPDDDQSLVEGLVEENRVPFDGPVALPRDGRCRRRRRR